MAALSAAHALGAPEDIPRAGPDRGAALYLRGELAGGAPLVGASPTGTLLRGRDAACANCHRNSGLGAEEGRETVPPVAMRYLQQSNGADRSARDLPYVAGIRATRSPYTSETLARAIREGVDADGRVLGPLMPRFTTLEDADMAALFDHLRKLDAVGTPGISDTELHVATIVTPDADPVARRGMLDVLRQFVADHNATQYASAPTLRLIGRLHSPKHMLRVHRRWVLHVWELEGAADTWQRQLERRLAAEPVFAVVSGLGAANWAPVARFCENAALPCLFPNAEVPPADADASFYSTYFSRGVLLEADLIAGGIVRARSAPARVRQIFRAGDAGAAAASRLKAQLAERGTDVTDEEVPAGAGEAVLSAAVQRTPADAVLVLWLRPQDLALVSAQPVPSGEVYASGLMGGDESAPLQGAWRETTTFALAGDLPDQARVRVGRAMGWFTLRRIPVVAPRVQADTYLACGLLAETMNQMSDVTVREYVIERLEDKIDHRVMTGHYPRMTLSRGQRFASKGGYLARFAAPTGRRLVATGDWTTP